MTRPARRVAASPPGPDSGAIDEAARILAAAENPLIVTASAGRDPAAVAALSDFARRFAIPVVQHRPRHLSLPADHPCHLGYDADPLSRRCRRDPGPRMRRAVGPEPQGAAAGVQDHPYRRRSAVLSAIRSAAFLRPRDDRARRSRRCRRSPRRSTAMLAEAGGRDAAARGSPGAATRMRAMWRKTAESGGDAAADRHGLGQRLHRPRQARGRYSGQRIYPDARALRRDLPRQLFRVEPGLGARLGRRRGAGRQARRTRPAGHRHARRRLASVRQPGGAAPRRGGAQPAGAVRDHEQFDVGRGAARDQRHVSRRARRCAATSRR